MTTVMQYFKPPFSFSSGYIFDSTNQMVAEVRAWGYLQYKPDPEKLQDELGEIIASSLTQTAALESETKDLKSAIEAGRLVTELLTKENEKFHKLFLQMGAEKDELIKKVGVYREALELIIRKLYPIKGDIVINDILSIAQSALNQSK